MIVVLTVFSRRQYAKKKVLLDIFDATPVKLLSRVHGKNPYHRWYFNHGFLLMITMAVRGSQGFH